MTDLDDYISNGEHESFRNMADFVATLDLVLPYCPDCNRYGCETWIEWAVEEGKGGMVNHKCNHCGCEFVHYEAKIKRT